MIKHHGQSIDKVIFSLIIVNIYWYFYHILAKFVRADQWVLLFTLVIVHALYFVHLKIL